MSVARVIKFLSPDSGPPAAPPRIQGRGFTTLDNETELTLLGTLPNALVKPALYLLSKRYRKNGVHWGDLAAFADRSQTQTLSALRELEKLGLAQQLTSGNWAWKTPKKRKSAGNPSENQPETHRKPVKRSVKNAVSDEENIGSNKGSKEIKKKTTSTADVEGAGFEEEKGVQALEGGLLDTAEDDALDNVPPAADAYNAAIRCLREHGLLDLWREWVMFCSMQGVVQKRQAVVWAEWVNQGLETVLREAVVQSLESEYAHPLRGLRGLMVKAAACQQATVRNAEEAKRIFGEPTCQSGERRRAPSGKVWTVAYVEHGVVYFDEVESPSDAPDVQVARWELVGGEA